jgi:hypothetical protein
VVVGVGLVVLREGPTMLFWGLGEREMGSSFDENWKERKEEKKRLIGRCLSGVLKPMFGTLCPLFIAVFISLESGRAGKGGEKVDKGCSAYVTQIPL